ncbi:MAG TPA: hypothetical protein VGL94_14140 [Ktedonobacteraceae bacterium]|jgi:hypothetical protein
MVLLLVSCGLPIGVVIGFYANPIPRGFDTLAVLEVTLTIAIAVLTIIGAFIVVSTWNNIEERTGKITGEYEKKLEKAKKELGDKVESILRDIKYAKHEVDDIKQVTAGLDKRIIASQKLHMQSEYPTYIQRGKRDAENGAL